MYQQWLQVVGLIFDGAGFALIALEWYRGYREMRNKVTLVTRNMERAEKIRLQRELKDAIGSVGVAEVGPIYNDDQALAEMAQHVFEIDQVDRFKKTHARLFFAGVVAFLVGMFLQLLGGVARMLRVHWHHSAIFGVSELLPSSDIVVNIAHSPRKACFVDSEDWLGALSGRDVALGSILVVNSAGREMSRRVVRRLDHRVRPTV